MSVRNRTRSFERNYKADGTCRGEAGRNDQGCGGNHEYPSLWDVYVACQSTGSSSYRRRPWRTDAAAMHAADRGDMDADSAKGNDRRSPLPGHGSSMYVRNGNGNDSDYESGADKSNRISKDIHERSKYYGRIFFTGSIRGGN